jgi:hypothetical protein
VSTDRSFDDYEREFRGLGLGIVIGAVGWICVLIVVLSR